MRVELQHLLLCDFSHNPLLSLKVFIPDSAEIPAPVKITTLEDSIENGNDGSAIVL